MKVKEERSQLKTMPCRSFACRSGKRGQTQQHCVYGCGVVFMCRTETHQLERDREQRRRYLGTWRMSTTVVVLFGCKIPVESGATPGNAESIIYARVGIQQ